MKERVLESKIKERHYSSWKLQKQLLGLLGDQPNIPLKTYKNKSKVLIIA
jgi:hypothetical protein